MNKKNLIFLINVCFFSVLSTLVIDKNMAGIHNFNENMWQYAVVYFLILFSVLLIEFTLIEKLSTQDGELTNHDMNHRFQIFKSLKLSTGMFIGCYFTATLALVVFTLIQFTTSIFGIDIGEIKAFGDKIDLNDGMNFINNGYGFNVFLIAILIFFWYIVWVSTRKLRTNLVSIILNWVVICAIILLFYISIFGVTHVTYLSNTLFQKSASDISNTTFLLAARGAIFSTFIITLISTYYKTYEIKKAEILPLSLYGAIFSTILYMCINVYTAHIIIENSEPSLITGGNYDLILLYMPKVIENNIKSDTIVIFLILFVYMYQILVYLSESVLIFKTILTNYIDKYNSTRYESSGKLVRFGFAITFVYCSMLGIFFIKNISIHYIFYYLVPINLLVELIMLFSMKLTPEVFKNKKIFNYIYKIFTFFVLPLICIYFIICTNLNGMAYGAFEYGEFLPKALFVGFGTIILVLLTPFLITQRIWSKRRKI